MSLLARFSIRTILNAVFLTLASALCVVLALQIAGAWHEVGSAQRIEALAAADRDVFQAMTTMRQIRGTVQTVIQAADDPAPALADNRDKISKLLESALKTAENADLAGGAQLISAVKAKAADADKLNSFL